MQVGIPMNELTLEFDPRFKNHSNLTFLSEFPSAHTVAARRQLLAMAAAEKDPLLLRAARGEKVERVPVWMMRQAGRHMQVIERLIRGLSAP